MGLRVENITKRFRDVTAVHDLSFTVRRPHLGIFGAKRRRQNHYHAGDPGIIKPDTGEVTWDGLPFAHWGAAFWLSSRGKGTLSQNAPG